MRTDHHSLKWLKTFKQPEGILARWIETLSEYDYEIEHRPGRLHSNADALSTCKQCWGKVAPTHWIDECERVEEIAYPLSVNTITMVPEFTAQLQAEDSEIGAAYRVLDPSPDELRGFPIPLSGFTVTAARSQNGGRCVGQGSARDHPFSGPYSSEVQAVSDDPSLWCQNSQLKTWLSYRPRIRR